MAGYRVFIKRSASKELEAIGANVDRQRIVARIQDLSGDPRPRGCEKLGGHDDRYRVRRGNYRIVYLVDDLERIVTVFKIGHRREIYR